LFLGVLVTLCTVAAQVSAASAADLAWTPPQLLSEAETGGEVPQVAMAEDGSALAAWWIHDTVTNSDRIQFSTRSRGGNFSVPPAGDIAARDATFLSLSDENALKWVRVAMNDSGDAIVVWEALAEYSDGSFKTVIQSAYRPAGGSFGPERTVVAADDHFGPDYVDPEVGIDGAGVATVIFHTPPAPFGSYTTKHSIFLSKDRSAGAGGTWGNLQELRFHQAGNDIEHPHYNERAAALAVHENGSRRAVVTSQSWPPDGGPPRQDVYEVHRYASPTWSTVGPNDGSPCCNDPGEDYSPHVVNEQYGTIAAWTHDDQLEAAYDSYASPTNFPNQVNTPPYDANYPATGSAFAVDSTGQGIALWSDGRYMLGNHATGYNFKSTDPGPVPGNAADTYRTNPALAIDANDDVLAVFIEKIGDDETIQAALRGPGGVTNFDTPLTVRHADNTTTTGAPVAISETGDVERDDPTKSGTGPQLAMDSAGEAVAVWSQQDSDGSYRVHVSLLVPQDNPQIQNPPPPPPPPPPPQPNPIRLARPMQRDQAVVLYANVQGPVSQLKWSFGTPDEPDIVAGVVDGRLQDAVRVRIPNETFTARLTVIGPDGPHSFSRALAQKHPSSSPEAKEVRRALEKTGTPPVFAVGDRATLTAEGTSSRATAAASCSPTTIWSGKQKIAGCFTPIEKLADVPNLERGAIKQLADTLHLDETKKDLMQKATQLTNGYVAQGRALINDQFPVIPKGGADVLSLPEAKSLISAKAELPVGSATFDPKNGFNLKVDPKKVDIPLGKLPHPPKLPSLGGLEIVGDWNVDLTKQEATITASLKLPQEVTKAGIRFDNEIKLRATPDRVIVDNARIGPIDVDIGALQVRAFKISYDRAADEWNGQAMACALVKACIDMSPPDGHITISHGRVTFAGASVRFPPPGIELFPGIDLTKIGFGMGFDPTRLIGSGRISAVQIVAVDGKMVLAFPSGRTPFVLRRDEVGNDFDSSLYGPQFTRTVVGMAGGMSFVVPETDTELKFAHGYMLYEYPGYIAAGGGGHLDIVGIIQLDGNITTAMDIQAERFNAHGDVHACWFESDDICGGAVANVSHGPNKEGGAGACIHISRLSIGGGVQWARVDDPFLWPLDGCKWSRFAIDVRPSAAGGITQDAITVRRGAPNPVLKLYGQDAAPLVSVSGPSGRLDGSSPGRIDLSSDGAIRIMRFDGNESARPFTVIGLDGAKPGNYSVQPLPGSGPITGSAHSHDLPDAKVSGRVTGKGRRRVLRYKLRRRPDQKVTFQEVEPGGAAKTIGTTTRTSGQVAWDSAPGRGRRKVFAQFSLAGIPAERKLVTTFKPQSPVLPRPVRVRVRRTRKGLAVSWRKVAGARRYEVAVALTTARMAFASTHREHVVVKHVPRWAAGRVTVRALDDLRQGLPSASRRFRGVGRQPSPLRPLAHCRVKKRKVACRRS
jgi:hypothetical protein